MFVLDHVDANGHHQPAKTATETTRRFSVSRVVFTLESPVVDRIGRRRSERALASATTAGHERYGDDQGSILFVGRAKGAAHRQVLGDLSQQFLNVLVTPVLIRLGQLFERRRLCSLLSKSTIQAPPCQSAQGRTDYLSSSAKTSPMILVILWAGSSSPPSASATSSEKASTE